MVNSEIDELKGSSAPTSVLESPVTSSITKYFKENIRQILKTVFETSSPTTTPIIILEELCEKLLKNGFSDMYCAKTYIKSYKKDLFAITKTKS